MTNHDTPLLRPSFGHCCAGCVFSPRRRLFTGALLAAGAGAALPALAREGVDVGKKSIFTGAISAEEVEKTATQQYLQMQRQYAQLLGRSAS